MRGPHAFAAVALGALAIGACAGGNAASQVAKGPEFAPRNQTKCDIAKSRSRPLIVEWPSADRLTLENKVRQGLVVIRYQGCEVDVLSRCVAPAKYTYLGATHAEDRVVMRDADDLYANMPVGAARLETQLERAGQLTVSMDLVGRYEAERSTVRADELQGECAGATHFVYGATVGAFDFYAGADANVGAAGGIGTLGAGAHSQAARETLTKNGDPAACAKAGMSDRMPPEGCGALLRIEVVPLIGNAVAGEAQPAPEHGASSTSERNLIARVAVAQPVPPHQADTGGTALPWRTAGWVVGGVGVVGIGVGAVAGLVAIGDNNSAHCNANHDCQPGPLSDARGAAVVSDVGFIAGGVLVASGAALVLFAPHEPEKRGAGLTVAPVFGARNAGVAVGGSW